MALKFQLVQKSNHLCSSMTVYPRSVSVSAY